MLLKLEEMYNFNTQKYLADGEAHIGNPSTWETEAGDLAQVQSQRRQRVGHHFQKEKHICFSVLYSLEIFYITFYLESRYGNHSTLKTPANTMVYFSCFGDLESDYRKQLGIKRSQGLAVNTGNFSETHRALS